MLWGAALAAGAESYRRHEDLDQATAVALAATRDIIASFTDKAETVNCREIIGIDLSQTFGLLKFILKTTLQGSRKNTCYNLADEWAPEAIRSAREGLAEEPEQVGKPTANCASEVVRRMGGSEKESVMVAGFAGGLGLSGNGCGALAAAVWMKTLDWCKANPGKNPPYFNNPAAKSILKAFKEETGSEMLCRKIAGRDFKSLDAHSDYIQKGGCQKLIDALAQGGKKT